MKKIIKNDFIADFVSGAFAGFWSTILNNPIDVVKTNMQGLEAKKFNSFFKWFKIIYQNEGIFGFYKGLFPRLMRVMLSVAFTFSLWNFSRRVLFYFTDISTS